MRRPGSIWLFSWFTCFLLTGSALRAQAPERLRIMTYNLLNYRNFTSYCPSSSNNPVNKEGYLAEIIAYSQPDLLVCNEINGDNTTAHGRVLNYSLNVNGETRWEKTDFFSNGSSLMNGIYYDQNKLGLLNQDLISKDVNNQNLVRGIDVKTFYYKDSLLSINPDTVIFTVFAAHLKAGSTASDIADRGRETAALMAYLASHNVGPNYFLAGDLNMPKSQEAGFQNLLNYSTAALRFYDPENQPGNWNNNYTFRNLHTQSTRDGATNNGCFSGGGLDDRFDHVLFSDDVADGTAKMTYVSGSLTPVGNDGLHFNSSINSPTNNSVPSNILTALYEMSDHLPVYVDIDVERLQISIHEQQALPMRILGNRLDGYWVEVSQSAMGAPWRCSDVLGRTLAQGRVESLRFPLPLMGASPGLRVFTLSPEGRQASSQKLP
ncbi:hypothetical protein OAV84_00025 [Schleiferiaceae bacterium]|nr:hypothetical protein [Schleiferiaceae bacterium]MDC3353466.1 hypothetical protein [Schleiferiaceae bacterium]